METFAKVILLTVIIALACSGVGPRDTCEGACSNLERLRCGGWDGSPGIDDIWGTEDDIGCVEICDDLNQDPFFEMKMECTTKALTCNQVDDCWSEETNDHKDKRRTD